MEKGNWQRAQILMLVSLLGGFLGMDKFYEGQIGLGVLKLVTGGGAMVWYLIDAARYAHLAGKDKPS